MNTNAVTKTKTVVQSNATREATRQATDTGQAGKARQWQSGNGNGTSRRIMLARGCDTDWRAGKAQQWQTGRPQERRHGQTDMQADRQGESRASTANHSQWDGPDIYIAMCVLMSRAHSAHNNIYIYVYIYIE